MIVDLCFSVATLIFAVTIFFQIHKNYKIKKVTSQSLLWHFSTTIGLCIILIGHIIAGYWFSVFITIFNIIERMILMLQIRRYWVGDP